MCPLTMVNFVATILIGVYMHLSQPFALEKLCHGSQSEHNIILPDYPFTVFTISLLVCITSMCYKKAFNLPRQHSVEIMESCAILLISYLTFKTVWLLLISLLASGLHMIEAVIEDSMRGKYMISLKMPEKYRSDEIRLKWISLMASTPIAIYTIHKVFAIESSDKPTTTTNNQSTSNRNCCWINRIAHRR